MVGGVATLSVAEEIAEGAKGGEEGSRLRFLNDEAAVGFDFLGALFNSASRERECLVVLGVFGVSGPCSQVVLDGDDICCLMFVGVLD